MRETPITLPELALRAGNRAAPDPCPDVVTGASCSALPDSMTFILGIARLCRFPDWFDFAAIVHLIRGYVSYGRLNVSRTSLDELQSENPRIPRQDSGCKPRAGR